MEPRDVIGRPLFVLSGAFFVSSVLTAGSVSSTNIVLGTLAATGAATLIIIILKTKRRSAALIALAAVFCAVFLSSVPSYIMNSNLESANTFDGETLSLTAEVKDVTYSSSYYSYVTADASFPDGKDRKISIGVPDGSVDVGDVLEGSVLLHKLDEDDEYLLSDGILLTGESDENGMSRVGSSNRFSVSSFFSKINKRLAARFRLNSENEAAALSSAILLGDRRELPSSVSRDFYRIGVSHILAISGLHLSVLVALTESIMIRFGAGRRKRSAALILSTLLFMALTGFSPSVSRAGIMHIMRGAASLLGRKSDSLTSLGVSAALIAAVDPFSAFDARLWLSVLSTLACILYSSRQKKREKYGNPLARAARSVADTVKFTLLVTALTLPVSWKLFGVLSLVSPLSNVLFIPLLTVYLYMSVVFLLLTFLPFPLSPASYFVNKTAKAILFLASAISHLRGIAVSLKYPAAGALTAVLFICVICTSFAGKRGFRLGCVCSAAAAVSLFVCLAVGVATMRYTSEAAFLNKKKNDGFILRNGLRFTVIDVSSGSSSFLSELIDVAENERAVEIEELVLTHYHSAHISSVGKAVCKNIVRKVIMPTPESDSDLAVCESLIELCRKENIEIRLYERANGESISTDKSGADGVTLKFYDHTKLSRSTHPIVCFSAELDGSSVTYLGSSFSEGSAEALNDASAADAVFFGAHPPVSKKFSPLRLSGDAVITEEAEGFLSDFSLDIDGDTVYLPSGGTYMRDESE